MKPTFSEEDRDDLRSLFLALSPFFDIEHQVIPLSYVRTLLLVGIEEGLGVSEYAQRAGVVSTVMTRNLLDIGERNRQKGEGLGLVTQERDRYDLRKHRAKLTPKGAKTLHDTLMALRRIRRPK